MSPHIKPAELRPHQLDTLLGDVVDGLVVTDPKGNVVYMNCAAQNLFGFGRLESNRQPRLDLQRYSREAFDFATIEGENVPEEDQPLTRALRGDAYKDVELSVRHRASRQEKFFVFSGTRLDGEPPLGVLTIRDVTDLRKAERRYRIAFETNPAPSLLVRLDDLVVIDANDGFSEVTGIPRNETAGSLLVDHEVFMEEDGLQHVIDNLKEGIETDHRHTTIKRRGAEARDVLMSARPIEIEGEACGIFTLADMTELFNSQRKVEQRTTELKEANAELDSFNYSVSHDLRAPLRGIDGFGQLILDEYGDSLDDRGRNYLERIRASAGYMGQLIDSLLTLSRLTRGEARFESVNLTEVAYDIAEGLREGNPDRKAEFLISDGMLVDGDEGMLRAAMHNLLENAWKFTRQVDSARIEVGSESRPEGPIYFVRDNGVGFDFRYAGKLFSPFERLHRRGEFEGQGIGLAIVQRIVHRHGGHIWAEEKPSGASFCFTLNPARVS